MEPNRLLWSDAIQLVAAQICIDFSLTIFFKKNLRQTKIGGIDFYIR